MSTQICYVITNEAFPDWVKIGFTSKVTMKSRLPTYQTGAPLRDYIVAYEKHFDDAKVAEREVHNRLKMMGATHNNHEWFKITVGVAKMILDSVGDDIENGIFEFVKTR